jgi:hypothetical protein
MGSTCCVVGGNEAELKIENRKLREELYAERSKLALEE